MKKIICFSLALLISLITHTVQSTTLKPWQVIPPTPMLPMPSKSGLLKINDTKIWYAEYGDGSPVILLHGGLTNSNYFGNLIPSLAKGHRVIVLDSRGHGRSFLGKKPLSYRLMAQDVLKLMDTLHIQKASIIGWSDGANTGIDLAIHHPARLEKLFAFGGNSSPEGTLDISKNPGFDAFSQRIEQEYLALSPTPSVQYYHRLAHAVETMWHTEPQFTKKGLQQIKVLVWIVSGDHDEAVRRSDTEFLASSIPHAKLVIESNVGHFAFLQNPSQFYKDVHCFLDN